MEYQRGDIIRLILQITVVRGWFGREFLITDAHTVRYKTIDTVRGGIDAGTLDASLCGKNFPHVLAGIQPRIIAVGLRRKRPKVLKHVYFGFRLRGFLNGFNPLCAPLVALQQTHFPKRTLAPLGRLTAFIPHMHTPKIPLTGLEFHPLKLHLHRIVGKNLTRIPHEVIYCFGKIF